MPQRIQRKRTRGWRMPEGAVYVGRPTIFGNPFRVVFENNWWRIRDDNDMVYDLLINTKKGAAAEAVSLFEQDLTIWLGGRIDVDPDLRAAIEGLRGKDLCCWCAFDQPCHADVLLDLANPA